MSLRNRLTSLAPTLSAKERAILLLRSHHKDEEEDPEVRRTMPAEQRPEFHRFLGLIYVANGELAVYIRVLAHEANNLKCDRDQIVLLEDASHQLEAQLGLEPPATVRGWRKRERITVPEFFHGLAAELRDSLSKRVVQHWQELRATELEWDEIAAELDGEDPVHPLVREQAAETATTLRELAAFLGLPAKRLTEPPEAMRAEFRALVDRAFKFLAVAAANS